MYLKSLRTILFLNYNTKMTYIFIYILNIRYNNIMNFNIYKKNVKIFSIFLNCYIKKHVFNILLNIQAF